MTVLIGLNVQEGIYLAADTRLTSKKKDGTRTYKDDFLKFYTSNHNIHCIVAGDAAFASFLLQRLRESRLNSQEYKLFKSEIEDFAKVEAALYPHISELPNVVFLFAGTDNTTNKVIDMNQVIAHTKYRQERGGSSKMRLRPEIIIGMVKAATTGKVGNLIETGMPFTGLFSLEVQADSSGIHTEITEVGWGELLLYGPNGLRREDVSPDLISVIDMLEHYKDNPEQKLQADASLIAMYLLKDLKEKHNLNTVGGGITFFWIPSIRNSGAIFVRSRVKNMNNSPDGLEEGTTLCSTQIVGNKICVEIEDKYVELKGVEYFYDNNLSRMEKFSLEI